MRLTTKKKRWLAILLTICMVISLAPQLSGTGSIQTALAADSRQTALACTFQESLHRHTDSCKNAEGDLICTYADFAIHTHDISCYDAQGDLACPLPEIREHAHTEACYQQEMQLVCTQPESTGHTHTSACESLHSRLVCAIPEHTHSGSCYETTQTLICGQSESAGHTHRAECYVSSVPLCGIEDESHIHDVSCYVSDVPLCGQPESAGHTHGASCYETVQTLVCSQSEHTHAIICYETSVSYTCGQSESAGHTHGSACYTNVPVLTCGKEEILPHTHTEDCLDKNGYLICGQTELLEHQHGAGCFTEATAEIKTAVEEAAETEAATEAETVVTEAVTEKETAGTEAVTEKETAGTEAATETETAEAETETEVQTETEIETETETETETEPESGPETEPETETEAVSKKRTVLRALDRTTRYYGYGVYDWPTTDTTNPDHNKTLFVQNANTGEYYLAYCFNNTLQYPGYSWNNDPGNPQNYTTYYRDADVSNSTFSGAISSSTSAYKNSTELKRLVTNCVYYGYPYDNAGLLQEIYDNWSTYSSSFKSPEQALYYGTQFAIWYYTDGFVNTGTSSWYTLGASLASRIRAAAERDTATRLDILHIYKPTSGSYQNLLTVESSPAPVPPETKQDPKGSLKITKTISNWDSSRDAGASFTFDVTITQNGSAYSGSYTVSTDGETATSYTTTNGKISVTLSNFSASSASFVIGGLPANATYAVTERTADGYTQESVSAVNGTIPSNSTASAGFTNKGDTTPETPETTTEDPIAYATITATKMLDTSYAASGAFQFALYEGKLTSTEGQTPIQTKYNGENGAITFDQIGFARSGVYYYTIAEIAGDRTDIRYDESLKYVTVTVSTDRQVDTILAQSGNIEGTDYGYINAHTMNVPGLDDSMDVYCIQPNGGELSIGEYNVTVNPGSAEVLSEASGNNTGGDLGENLRKILYFYKLHPSNSYVITRDQTGLVNLTLDAQTRQSIISYATGSSGGTATQAALSYILKTSNPPSTFNVVLFTSPEGYQTTIGALDIPSTLSIQESEEGNNPTFTNTTTSTETDAADLTIGKKAEGTDIDPTATYRFTITMNNYTVWANQTIAAEGGVLDGVTGVTAPTQKSVTFDSRGDATVSLKAGQTLTLKFTGDNAPYQAFSVKEPDAVTGGYTVSVTGGSSNVTDRTSGQVIGRSGVLGATGSSTVLTFTNTRDKTEESTTLTFAKKISGNLVKGDESFTFAVYLPEQKGETLDVTPSGGAAVTKLYVDSNGYAYTDSAHTQQVTLKHGQKLTVSIPAATVTYTITEPNAVSDGYAVTVSGGTAVTDSSGKTYGVSGTDTEAPSVTITNTKNLAPGTGVRLDIMVYAVVFAAAAGLTLIAAAGKWKKVRKR